MTQNDTSIFRGHRDRMRAKLRNFGSRFLETYELLEMLLYNVISRRNTHPTAKLLLKEFSTLDGIFSASPEELSNVSGIGKECAEFIACVAEFINYNEAPSQKSDKKRFSDYRDVGNFFFEYFKGIRENEIAILLLDPELNYIDCKRIYSLDLASGAVQPKPFIDSALKANASVCAIAHNHPFAPPFPTDGDWESDKMLKLALKEAGIVLLENYVVTNEGCKPFSNQLITPSECKTSFEREMPEPLFPKKLLPLLKYATKTPENALSELTKAFSSREELFEASASMLCEITGIPRLAELLVITAALASRKSTELFKFGKAHTEEEIKNFLVGFYMNFSHESAVILSLDEDGRVISIDTLSDGTVNSLNIIPRMILEKLATKNSTSFILAHNHPGGSAAPSQDDVASSANLAASLEKCGVILKEHYVVAKKECNKIDFR